LRGSYVGPAIRVRRSSDNIEINIGFTDTGEINIAELLSHVGSGTGFVTTWYDQSVNGRNAVQTTPEQQPRIVVNGVLQMEGGRATILFNGINETLGAASWGLIAQPFSRHYVGVRKSYPGISHWINSVEAFPNTAQYDFGNTSHAMYAGAGVSVSLSNDERAVLSSVYNVASSYMSKNGVLTTGDPGTQGFAGIRIGGQTASNSLSNINMQELILIASPSVIPIKDRQTIESSQGSFYSIPIATLPLDQISVSSAAAYSLRKVRAGYTGAAIRVRRTDNQEDNIGFTASGDLDTAALLAFVGSSNGFVTTWYDQSGNGRNATQTTAASQPRLVVNGVLQTEGGKPAILFDGVDDSLAVATWGTITQPFSRHYVGVRKSFVGASHWINSVDGSATSATVYDPAAGQHSLYAGGFWGAVTVSLIDNERAVFSAAYNDSSSYMSKNGVLTTGLPGDQGFSGIRIGCRSSIPAVGYANITMQELIVVASGSIISTLNRQLIESSQRTFYDIPL
jgi:hypothetical protein